MSTQTVFRRTTFAGVFGLVVMLVGCGPSDEPPRSPVEQAAEAAVAMPDEHSATASRDVLERGGNAVDAAVAAAFVLSVTYPEAGNLGGGGFMLIHKAGQNEFLDYREIAPAAASRDMYLDEGGDPVPGLSLIGHKAAGVPGTVAGLAAAHERHGSLPWADLIAPAIRLADTGFVMSEHLANRIEAARWQYADKTNFDEHFARATPGEVFRQPELAATLKRIASEGPADFYEGKTATLIAADMQANQGLIAKEDLAGYRVRWRDPLITDWRGRTLISAPPPSSGGFAVIQLLKMKDYLANDFAGLSHNSPHYIHLIAEMEKRVFADRAEYLGDPDFVSVPMAKLLADDYIIERAAAVNPDAISTVEGVPPGLESPDTTHFSIIDFDGNAVSNTFTLNTSFGNGVVVSGAGFLLNNEMDDFSIKPNVPNFYGVVGGSANAIEPGKRMLSSMSPTIIVNGERPELVIGTPGGTTIFTSVFQGIVNLYDFEMAPAEAASATRFHHQLLPADLVTYSRGQPLSDATIDALKTRGYRALAHPWEFGDLQIVFRSAEGLKAGSDNRGRGRSVVFKKADDR